MGLFFGTDGIRGIVGKNLTFEIVYRCGVALALQKNNVRILLGKDTRKSGDILSLLFAAGALSEGAYVEDLGICPTASVGYLTKKLKFDYGVVISASHNSFEFNGIKIFDCNGRKINENVERKLEKLFFYRKEIVLVNNLGSYLQSSKKLKLYEKFLIKQSSDLKDLRIVLDCANGASSFVAEKVFKKLNAEVLLINNKPNGININEKCGALFIENLKETVLKNHADFGFAFDGDADRLIAIDENGNIVDGDMIVYLFAINFLNKKETKNKVVGTYLTNYAIEQALNKNGIDLIRTDVGDKFIDEVLEKNKLIVGGEQCGHVFVKNKLSTGDGILNAILIANICKTSKKKLSNYFNLNKYVQVKKDVLVCNKNNILKCKKFSIKFKKTQLKYKHLRCLIRPSGTEQLIRIMVESKDMKLAQVVADELELLIKEVDEENICVE